MCGLPKPTSNVPAQTKRHALTALRPYRWPPHGLPFVPKWFRRWAPASDEGLLQSGQLAVLESQPETVLERRGIHGQVLHPQVDQVVGCLEAAVPSNIDGSETDRRRGKPVLGTWTVGEESIPIRRQRHRSHSRTSADSARMLARSRLEVAADQRARPHPSPNSLGRAVDHLRRLSDGSRQRREPSIRNRTRPNRIGLPTRGSLS